MRAALLALVLGVQAWGQCSMCRTAMAAQGAKAASTIDSAVLILLVPAVTMFSGVLVLSFRYRFYSDGRESENE